MAEPDSEEKEKASNVWPPEMALRIGRYKPAIRPEGFCSHFCHTQEPLGTGQAYTPLAIIDQCAYTIMHRGPRTSNGYSILTRPSVGRS